MNKDTVRVATSSPKPKYSIICGRRPDGAALAKLLRMAGKKKLAQGRGSTDAFKTRMPVAKVMYHRLNRDQSYRLKAKR